MAKWAKGQSGNPNARPHGTHDWLTEAFIDQLAEDDLTVLDLRILSFKTSQQRVRGFAKMSKRLGHKQRAVDAKGKCVKKRLGQSN